MDSDQFDPDRDLTLVRGFQNREPVAVAELEKHLQRVPRILSSLNARLGRPLDSDELADLAQDTVVIILRKLDAYAGRAPFGAWVYRVCSNELRNGIRRKRRMPTLLGDGGAGVVSHQDEVMLLARRELVLQALEQIRRIDAEVVRLHHLDGLTFVDVSERLGVTVNTVKGRYYRGIQQLHDLLGGNRRVPRVQP